MDRSAFENKPTNTSDSLAIQSVLGLERFWVPHGFDQVVSTTSYSYEDYLLLAKVISAEARGESYEGQVAVGAVIVNRVSSQEFPNTLYDVVYQPAQFTYVDDGQINQPISDSCYKAAQEAMIQQKGVCIITILIQLQVTGFLRLIDYRIGNHVFSKGEKK